MPKKINQLNFLSKTADDYSRQKSKVTKKLDEIRSAIKRIEDQNREKEKGYGN